MLPPPDERHQLSLVLEFTHHVLCLQVEHRMVFIQILYRVPCYDKAPEVEIRVWGYRIICMVSPAKRAKWFMKSEGVHSICYSTLATKPPALALLLLGLPIPNSSSLRIGSSKFILV